ncbi:hypothetical protein, partial [Streptomyces sp. NPDC002666]
MRRTVQFQAPPGESAEREGAGRSEPLRTEFAFDLPRGYVDESGTVHRSGVMRLATARDELVPLRDDRVRENSAYLSVVLISRVVTRIGTVEDIHPGVIEDLFASDLAFPQATAGEIHRELLLAGRTRHRGAGVPLRVDPAVEVLEE